MDIYICVTGFSHQLTSSRIGLQTVEKSSEPGRIAGWFFVLPNGLRAGRRFCLLLFDLAAILVFDTDRLAELGLTAVDGDQGANDLAAPHVRDFDQRGQQLILLRPVGGFVAVDGGPGRQALDQSQQPPGTVLYCLAEVQPVVALEVGLDERPALV